MQELISLKEAAECLGISMATVLNWEKLGYLTAVREKKRPFYNHAEIISTREKIEKGLFEKLGKRANKKKSSKTFLPQEYLTDPNELDHFNQIIKSILQNNAGTEESLFFLSLNLLLKNGLIFGYDSNDLINFKSCMASNPFILEELESWLSQIELSGESSFYSLLVSMEIPSSGDILGVIYQSLLTEGHKSREGSYYTPQCITRQIASDHLKGSGQNLKILDPCCGTGQFLLAAADVILQNNPEPDPACLWGYDIDPLAVRIARINLFLKFRNVAFIPNIYKKNIILHYSLGNHAGIEKEFDLVIGNPPWGAELKFEQVNFLKDNFTIIKSLESFSYFIYIGLELLKKGGILSFILPESITNIKTHKDIRAYILRNSRISHIEQLGKIFNKVFTNVVRIDLVKDHLPQTTMRINAGGRDFEILTRRFEKNQDKVFDIYTTPEDEEIIRKVYETPYTTLYRQAEWALGIVTGNNKGLVISTPDEGCEPVYRGKDIEKFYFSEPSGYIRFIPENFQQVAPEEIFRVQEKLVYRFISSKLVVAYDNRQRLTLNSANIFIPRFKTYPVKLILALFNSSLYQFIFQKKFFTHKVLRSQLEQLPLPLWDQQYSRQLISITENLVLEDLAEGERKYLHSLLDELVFDFFQLTKEERNIVGLSQSNNCK